MNDEHPILTTVGIATVALGVLMVLQPGLAAAIGVDYAAVLLVGMIALVQGIRVARARQRSEIRGAETPDVETVETVPTPGDEFDRTVATLRSGPRRVLIRERADLRDTLEDVAVTAVADRENCSREAAEELIEDGTWTDDVHAATLLGGPGAPSPPLFHRLKLATSTESPFQFRVRRTADAVARAAGVTADEDDSDEGTTGGDAPSSGGSSAGGTSAGGSTAESVDSAVDPSAGNTDGSPHEDRPGSDSPAGRGSKSDAKSDPDQSDGGRSDENRRVDA